MATTTYPAYIYEAIVEDIDNKSSIRRFFTHPETAQSEARKWMNKQLRWCDERNIAASGQVIPIKQNTWTGETN